MPSKRFYSCCQYRSIHPDRSDFNYSRRPRSHNLVLTAKSSSDVTLPQWYSKTFTDADIYLYSYSIFPVTCFGYCLTLYILFLIHFGICIHFTLSRYSLSTWIKVLIKWLNFTVQLVHWSVTTTAPEHWTLTWSPSAKYCSLLQHMRLSFPQWSNCNY